MVLLRDRGRAKKAIDPPGRKLKNFPTPPSQLERGTWLTIEELAVLCGLDYVPSEWDDVLVGDSIVTDRGRFNRAPDLGRPNSIDRPIKGFRAIRQEPTLRERGLGEWEWIVEKRRFQRVGVEA